MSAEWVPVFIGSFTDGIVLHEALNANGVPCLAPGIDNPEAYADGKIVHSFALLVPPDRIDDALRLIPASQRSGIPRAALPPGEVG
jgi:hypothetical protein